MALGVAAAGRGSDDRRRLRPVLAAGQESDRRRSTCSSSKPVDTVYGIGELLLKASPLMLIAVGLAVGYRANVWNIGAEGQLTHGRDLRRRRRARAARQSNRALVLPLMLVAGVAGGMAVGGDPGMACARASTPTKS